MKKIFLALITLSLFGITYGQNQAGTLLWKVTKPNNDKTSYLFGTFHQVNPDFLDSLNVVTDVLLKSEMLFVEAYHKEDSTNTSKIPNQNYSYFGEWDKERWKSISTENQFNVFEKFSKSGWVNEKMFSLSPLILIFILQDMYFQGICDTLNRTSYEKMDDRIISLGIQKRINIRGLDDDQLLDIKKSSEKDIALSEKNTVKSLEIYANHILNKDTDNPIAKFLYDYKRQELDYSLNKRIKGLNHLLKGRNDKWMKILLEQLDAKNCFVAVGIRHLFYKDGLIEQLRKQGYIVEPIKPLISKI